MNKHIIWWHGLSALVRDLLTFEYYGDISYSTLEENEIKHIYNQEN